MSALVPFPERVRWCTPDGYLTQEALRVLETLRSRVGNTLGDMGADVFAAPEPVATGSLETQQHMPAPDALSEQVLQVVPYSAGTALQLANYSFSLKDTAVIPGTYGDAANVAKLTVDQQGRLTFAQAVPIQIAMSQVTGLGTMAAQNVGTNFSGSFTGKTVTVSNGIITSVV